MTWKELVEKAKELGYELWDDNIFVYPNLCKNFIHFDAEGTIYYENGEMVQDLAYNRTPEQMYQIMLALE